MSKIVFRGVAQSGTPYLIRYPKRSDLQELLRYINELSKEKTFISFQGEEVSLEDERKFLNDSIRLIRDKKRHVAPCRKRRKNYWCFRR